jgi:hypothetical protein
MTLIANLASHMKITIKMMNMITFSIFNYILFFFL